MKRKHPAAFVVAGLPPAGEDELPVVDRAANEVHPVTLEKITNPATGIPQEWKGQNETEKQFDRNQSESDRSQSGRESE